ncbi:MAG: hypothetical protein RLY64_854 [Bacteroidota bacterium]|jgi:uncharacterized protein (TIGR00255 family)
MMQSMTGFGSASAQTKLGKVTIELRALNSKQLDLNIRLPKEFSHVEANVRQAISAKNQRGKITCSIHLESDSNLEVRLNKELANSYLNQLKEFVDGHSLKEVDYLSIISRMPEVFSGQTASDEEDEREFISAVHQACDSLNQFRFQEGLETQKAITNSVREIQSNLNQIQELDAERIALMKEKFEIWVKERMTKAAFDHDRFEQELIYYLEKLDVSEEKQRLNQHINFFQESMNEAQAGRKLGFIAQEMGREINTLGSKANHFGIQQKVVEMKNELEKIKEQVLNIL